MQQRGYIDGNQREPVRLLRQTELSPGHGAEAAGDQEERPGGTPVRLFLHDAYPPSLQPGGHGVGETGRTHSQVFCVITL